MLTLYYVLCLYILTVESAKVTINYGKKSYWHQTLFSEVFNYNSVSHDITYETIKIEKYYDNDHVKEIKNFPDLEAIEMDKADNKEIPKLFNLPKLKTISLMNNDIRIVHRNSFSTVPLEMIVLSSNNISFITNGSFGTNLKRLHLVCNQLTYLSPYWFRNPAALEYFSVTANKIEEIPANMFKEFTQLHNLILRNNEIKTIGYHAFSGLNNLEQLELSYNKLLEIQPYVLDSKNKLKLDTLDLQYNKLTFLHKEFLDNIQTKAIKIWGNPWQCPCRDMIYKWINENVDADSYQRYIGQIRSGDPSCVRALTFANACVYSVDEELVETFYENFNPEPLNICALFLE